MNALAPYRVQDDIPKVCRVSDVLRILQLPRSTFYYQRERGTFPIPELLPRVGSCPRFSGADVARYLDNHTSR